MMCAALLASTMIGPAGSPADRPPLTRVAERAVPLLAYRPPITEALSVHVPMPVSCAAQAKAYEQCAEPLSSEIDDPDSTPIAAEPPLEFTPLRSLAHRYTLAGRAAQLKKYVSLFNTASAKIVRCRRLGREVQDACEDAPAMEVARGKATRTLVKLDQWQNRLMTAMNKISLEPDAVVASNCLLTPRDGVPVMRCYALDPVRTKSRYVRDAEAASLDMVVGISRNCTFTVMADGRLLTADHCGPNSLLQGVVMNPVRPEPLSASFNASLAASAVQLSTGKSFEDLAVWRAPVATIGRPFYILTRDPTRDGGCRIVDGLFVACAPSEYLELTGQRGHVLGFPVIKYKQRATIDTVVLSEGDVVYDQATDRVLIHAAVSPGSSGGPTWISAGFRIGGQVLDLPLYIGPVTNVNRARRITSEFAADTLVVVGVYDLEHVRAILPATGH